MGLDVVARSSERANCSLGCPAVVGCSRLSVGNTHGSVLVDRHRRCSPACRSWTVNPSRKLRRFESFTCHHVLERASDLRKRGSEVLVVYPVGVSKRHRFGGPQSFGSQACDLRKRANLIGWRWVRPEYAGKFGSTPPCWPDSASADLRGRWGWGYVIAVEADTIAIGRRQCRSFSSETSRLTAQVCRWTIQSTKRPAG